MKDIVEDAAVSDIVVPLERCLDSNFPDHRNEKPAAEEIQQIRHDDQTASNHYAHLTADHDYFRRMLFHGYHDKARSPTEDADNEPDGKRTSEHLATPHLCKDMTSPPILTRILRDLNEERP